MKAQGLKVGRREKTVVDRGRRGGVVGCGGRGADGGLGA